MESGWPTIKTNEDARVAREENGVVLRTTFILTSSILVFATPIGLIISASSTDFISPSHQSNSSSIESTTAVASFYIQNSIWVSIILWDWVQIWILAWRSRKINVEYKRSLKLQYLHVILILGIHILVLVVYLTCVRKLNGKDYDDLLYGTLFTLQGVELHIILYNAAVKCKMFKLYKNHIDSEWTEPHPSPIRY